MTVQEILNGMQLNVVAGSLNLNNEVTGGYASDLLSNVMGQANPGNIWVTMQGHQNIVAVASLANLSAIVMASGVEPDKDTITKAEKEGVVLLSTLLPVFEVAGILYQMGIKGV